MKKLFILSFIALSFAACKKQTCYTCETAAEQKQFCDGDPNYELIDNGQVITDPSGDVYECH